MRTLSPNLLIQKNKIASDAPWLILLQVTFTDEPPTTLYLVRNVENVIFDGQEYTAFPFEMDAQRETSKGEIPTISVRVSNVSRTMEYYMEEPGGAVGATVSIVVVNAAYLDENYADLTLTYEIIATTADANWVTFTLGAAFITRRRFPLYRYLSDRCLWLSNYGEIECGYTIGLPTCKGTLEDCQAHGNSTRFGGKIGLGTGGVKFA